jgi:sugar/nucleoside kinase (ribokinase family)
MTGRRGVICAGNWIVDLVHDIDRWPNESELVRIGQQTRGIGGGAANVLSALARLQTGLPLFPMGAVGNDEHGDFVLAECQTLGLLVAGLVQKPGIATAHTHVMSVAGQSRTFFYQGGANDVLGLDDFPKGTFTDTKARIFYLGYLTLLGELDVRDAGGATNAAKVLERAKAAGLTTCVDLVSMHHPQFRQIVQSAAPSIDYLVANEIEAGFATGHTPSTQAEAMKNMAAAVLDMGVRKAVVLHSVERSVWVGGDGQASVVDINPVPAEQIASNLGAGDAFCAGLIYAVHEGMAPMDALGLANATARASLSGMTATGAIPPLIQLDGFSLKS